MVKITTRALIIGVQSPFGPISTVGSRTFLPKNFGQAMLTCHYYIATWPGQPDPGCQGPALVGHTSASLMVHPIQPVHWGSIVLLWFLLQGMDYFCDIIITEMSRPNAIINPPAYGVYEFMPTTSNLMTFGSM